MTTFTATLQDGTEIRESSKTRTFTHFVALAKGDGSHSYVRASQSIAAAQKAAKSAELRRVAQRYDATIYVVEAHEA